MFKMLNNLEKQTRFSKNSVVFKMRYRKLYVNFKWQNLNDCETLLTSWINLLETNKCSEYFGNSCMHCYDALSCNCF